MGQSFACGLSKSLLLDIGGNDVFEGGKLIQGYGNGGLAFFINIFGVDDYSGPGKDCSIWLQGTGIGIDVGGRRFNDNPIKR